MKSNFNKPIHLISWIVLCCFTTTTLGWARGESLYSLHPPTGISDAGHLGNEEAVPNSRVSPDRGRLFRLVINLAVSVGLILLSYLYYPGELWPTRLEVAYPAKGMLSNSGEMTYVRGHDPAAHFSLTPVKSSQEWSDDERYLSFRLILPPQTSNIHWLKIGDRIFYPDEEKGLQTTVRIDTKPYRRESAEGVENVEIPVTLGIKSPDRWFELAFSDQNWLRPIPSLWMRVLIAFFLVNSVFYATGRFVVSVKRNRPDYDCLAAAL